MKLLVVGGSGMVGSLIAPTLAMKHQVRVFDLNPPPSATSSSLEFVSGSVADYDALRGASVGTDVLVYLAMGPKVGFGTPENVSASFDVSVKGVYIALWAAAEEGVRHAVYASSLSVYRGRTRYLVEDDEAPDADTHYGYTKRLGEDVCRQAVRTRGMSVNALRLCHPTPDDEWPSIEPPLRATLDTRGTDVAAAFEAALHYRDGFQAFTISGDSEERVTQLGKAARLLNWRPAPRPFYPSDSSANGV